MWDRIRYELGIAFVLLVFGGLLSQPAISVVVQMALFSLPYVGFTVFRIYYKTIKKDEIVSRLMAWAQEQSRIQSERALTPRAPTKIDLILPKAFSLVGITLALYGLLMVSAQAVEWLRHDSWVSISTGDLFLPHSLRGTHEPFAVAMIPDLFLEAEAVERYLTAPRQGTWLGVRRVVLFTLQFPLALTFWLVGMLIAGLASVEMDKIRESIKKGNPESRS